MKIAHDRILKYALNTENKLVLIDTVPNGLNCGCICPYCHQGLIAKNGGQYREKHFAHAGNVCSFYYETALHLLAKEIIKNEKTVMLPTYKHLTAKQIRFKTVEIEERNDSSSLQPDCVGVTEDGLRIHIEIFVTHKVDEKKREKIRDFEINCLEIHIPNDFPQDREKLKEFIENSTDGRDWIYCPFGEEILKKEEQLVYQKRARWYMRNAKEWLRTPSECDKCKLNKASNYPWEALGSCQYRLEDIEHEGIKYIVCRNMFYFHDNQIDKEGVIPTKDANGKLSREVGEEEQRIWDIANGICPLCQRQVRKRSAGEHGVFWGCENPLCSWICTWEY